MFAVVVLPVVGVEVTKRRGSGGDSAIRTLKLVLCSCAISRYTKAGWEAGELLLKACSNAHSSAASAAAAACAAAAPVSVVEAPARLFLVVELGDGKDGGGGEDIGGGGRSTAGAASSTRCTVKRPIAAKLTSK